jgi:hypothetical protein
MSTSENLLTFKRGAGVTNVDRGGGRRWAILGSRLLQTDRAVTLSRSRGTAPLQALALRHRLGVFTHLPIWLEEISVVMIFSG